jgi:guanylate kinase
MTYDYDNFAKKHGTLIVIVGPSGAGKTTLVRSLVDSMTNLKLSVSHTTRPIRPEEKEGANYYFITEAEFHKLLDEQVFLEHANVYGHFYGTSRVWVEEELKKGTDIILELDWQGAQQIKKMFGSAAVFIYVLPPSLEDLKRRLENRAQDQPGVIANRLAKAKDDISHYEDFDYLVVNCNLRQAVFELQAIIISIQLRTSNQKVILNQLIKQLLE